MSEIVKPTCRELAESDDVEESDFELVDTHSDNSWRHGTRETTIFRRISDNTFWQACYLLSTDRETNELRDGGADIAQVWPKQVTTVKYTSKRP